MRSARVILLAGALVLTGCAGSGSGGDSPPAGAPPAPAGSTPGATTPGGADATASAATSPTPAADPTAEAAARAATGAQRDYTARYALDPADEDAPGATVTLALRGDDYRVDVEQGGDTATLIDTAEAGVVSCQVGSGSATCLQVAEPGETPGELFDPGVQRIFTGGLDTLAGGEVEVSATRTIATDGGLPAAQCYAVAGTDVAEIDSGEYCLAEDGTVREAVFPSGTLTLLGIDDPPGDAAFAPPASPTPLPAPTG